jgi:DNA topoisomerase IA
MVVEREREIEAFNKTEYWTIGSKSSRVKQPPPFDARLLKVASKTSRPAVLTRILKRTKF